MYSDEDTASNSKLDRAPLYQRDIPGIMTQRELEEFRELSGMKVKLGDAIYEVGDLVTWDTSELDEPGTIKSFVAELVAALGTQLAKKMCVSFD